MNILESIVQHINLRGTEHETIGPQGLCPNCWGRTEYGGKFYTQLENENLDINNKNSKIGWIQAYAERNFKNITLKKSTDGKKLICDACNSTFQDEM